MRSSWILAEIRDLRAETNALIAEIRGEAARNREVIRRNERVMAELVDAVREIKDEVGAETQAIFRFIDRLDGGTAPA